MKLFKMIMSGVWGGAFGYTIVVSATEGNWAMATLAIGLIVAIFYIVIWIIDVGTQ